jgi:hypothetical protein
LAYESGKGVLVLKMTGILSGSHMVILDSLIEVSIIDEIEANTENA